ncbi:hypothetical protein FQA39_LY07237 [Lamprigera yunnana]|nr:hypothetical protein FQA39_LY07237 [Lamprigera yunnana]
MHSRGKKLVNLALLEGNKQVDNNATPTGSSEVQMNDDFNDFGSDDSVADKDYVPSATSSSESELDVGGKSDSESDILNAENSDTEVENTQDNDDWSDHENIVSSGSDLSDEHIDNVDIDSLSEQSASDEEPVSKTYEDSDNYLGKDGINLALVSVIEDYPLIYDKSHRFYKDVIAKKNAFAAIAEMLNLQHQTSNPAEYYEKRWLQLRKRFTEECRKRLPSGSAASTYMWPLFNAMQYLDAHTSKRLKCTVGNVQIPIETTASSCISQEANLEDIENLTSETIELILKDEDTADKSQMDLTVVENTPKAFRNRMLNNDNIIDRCSSRASSTNSKESASSHKGTLSSTDEASKAIKDGMDSLTKYLEIRSVETTSKSVDLAIAEAIARN